VALGDAFYDWSAFVGSPSGDIVSPREGEPTVAVWLTAAVGVFMGLCAGVLMGLRESTSGQKTDDDDVTAWA
jgi:hypothetical protein